jgi:hypothetical protein
MPGPPYASIVTTRPAPATGGIFKTAAVEVLRRTRRLMTTGEICRHVPAQQQYCNTSCSQPIAVWSGSPLPLAPASHMLRLAAPAVHPPPTSPPPLPCRHSPPSAAGWPWTGAC